MDPNNEINFFAKTNFRNREVPFGIKTDDRRRHMYLIGKTGMGKTTLMENMVLQDIRAGHGVCFIDPHGDSVMKILDFIPNNRVNDVIYFNPADLEFPIAFNILEAVDTKYKHLVASGLMGVFTKIWANLWSARMEYILNNTILALLDSPGNTMLGIARMYIDKRYRKKIVDSIKDPMVKSFWTDEFANYNEKYRSEAVAPIQNKVGQFLSSSIIRNIVGQPRSTIDLRGIMDNKKILLIDLSKGKVGEDNSALLGAMIITKLQLAALSRVDIPEEERKDFYLYVDEFQNFVTDSFATILSEARKYHLNLVMGHQYIGQLAPDRNNTRVRDAVFGNVGTMVCFRIGAADAEFLETEFDPTFTPNDLLNLPKAHVILKLMINGVSSEPFSAITLPPIHDNLSDNKEKVIKVSRERYGNPAAEVEERISRWMGAEFHEQTAIIIGQSEAGDGGQAALPEVSGTEQITVHPPTAVAPPTSASSEAAQPAPESFAGSVAAPAPENIIVDSVPEPIKKQAAPPVERRENPDRRRFDRRDNGPEARNQLSRNRRPSGRKRSFGRRQESKIENPVWNTAHQLAQEKTGQIADNVARAVGQFFTPSEKPAIQPEPTLPAPPRPVDNNVIKPGEVHKF